MTTVLYVFAAVIMLGVMVLIHECGHFFAARLTGIPVREFGIGFGPKIAEKKSKKYDTLFVFRLIPAGGYCAFYGEDDPSAEQSDDTRLMNAFPVWKRIVTVLMGPFMNFILAFIVAVCFYAFAGEQVGIDYGYTVIQEVSAGSPAERAGLQRGDRILQINGDDMEGLADNGEETKLTQALSAYRPGDDALELLLDRNGTGVSVLLTPEYDETEQRMLMGVMVTVEASYITVPCSFSRAVQLGAQYCVTAGGAILDALRNLLATGEGIEDTGGPIRIIQTVTEETQQGGFEAYISLFILISVNLGLMNLLPIPGLDGSRLIFLFIEGIFRKPVPRKAEAYIHLAGYAVLICLFIILTYRDIVHLFR